MGCGNGTKVKDDPLAFRNHFPLPVRVMIGIFGAVLLLLPYRLLIAPNWNHFSWLLIPYGLIGLAGGIGGIFFVISALRGQSRETRLDLSCQQLIQTSRDLLFRPKVIRTPFRDIAILELSQPDWATEETVLTITPVKENGKSLPAFGAFPSREEAQKIMALMGHMPDGLSAIAPNWSTAEIEALKRSLQQDAMQSQGAASGPSCTTSCGCRPMSEESGANQGIKLVQ